MTPQDHKNAILAAMLRCCRAYGTTASPGAIAGFEQALDVLVKELEVSSADRVYLEAKLQKLAAEMEAVGAGGVDGRRITGGAG